MNEIKKIILYSSSLQKIAIETFLSQNKGTLFSLIITDKDLPAIRRECKVNTIAPTVTDIYVGLEAARKLVNQLYDLQMSGRPIFNEYLCINGYSILEIMETSFINYDLGPILSTIRAILQRIRDMTPEQIFIFKPFGIFEKIVSEEFPRKVVINKRISKYRLNSVEALRRKGLSSFLHFLRNTDNILGSLFYGFLSNLYVFWRKIRFRSVHKAIQKYNGPNSQQKIIFLTVNKKQIDSIIPLVQRLQDDRELFPLVVDFGSDAKQILEKKRIHYEQFDSYFTIGILSNGIRTALLLTKKWKIIKRHKKLFKKLKFENHDFSEIILTILDRIFRFDIYPIIKDYFIVQKILKKANANGIFVTNERESRAKTSVFAAKSIGVKTFNIQRGIIADHPEVGPLSTEIMFVNGLLSKQILVKRGVNPDKLIITGNPRFDEYLNQITEKNPDEIIKEVYDKLGINREEKICLIIEQPLVLDVTVKEKLRLLRLSLFSMSNKTNVRCIIKLHPSQEDYSIERKVLLEAGITNGIILRDEISIFNLLLASKLVTLRHSTVGFDAVILEKPIITIGDAHGRDLVRYFDYGVAQKATNSEEFSSFVENIFSPDSYFQSKQYQRSRKKFIHDYLYKFDGNCTLRVIEAMKEILKKH